jgi:phosphoribosyl 1,2-cyclic phosphate phosphodiesterase
LLRERVAAVDAVFITHDHADQLHGLDDLRQIAHFTRKRVDVYTDGRTAKTMLKRFAYCFQQPEGSSYPAIANLYPTAEPPAEIEIKGAGGYLPVRPFWQQHGDIRSLGFRFGPIAYSPDVNELDDKAFAALEGVDTWIVDALRYKPHPTHASVAQALEWIERVKPRRAILTNLQQDLDYETLKRELPPHVEPAFDGQRLAVSY